jgi:hypothetical protein
VGTLLLTEKEHLLPLAAEEFELAEVSFPRVDQAGCARAGTNFYSVPLKTGSVVEARVYFSMIEFRTGRCVGGAARAQLCAGAADPRSRTLWAWG